VTPSSITVVERFLSPWGTDLPGARRAFQPLKPFAYVCVLLFERVGHKERDTETERSQDNERFLRRGDENGRGSDRIFRKSAVV
jgi:hypothetical protein